MKVSRRSLVACTAFGLLMLLVHIVVRSVSTSAPSNANRADDDESLALSPVTVSAPAIKLFVYNLGHQAHIARNWQTCVYDRPLEYDQYAEELRIVNRLLDSAFLTSDPETADFFLVPVAPMCFMKSFMAQWASRGCDYEPRYKYDRRCAAAGAVSPREALNEHYKAVLEEIALLPYFARRRGKDHVFIFPHGQGANDFRDWRYHIRHSIFLTPEGNAEQAPIDLRADDPTWFRFEPYKDIVIPGHVGHWAQLAATAEDARAAGGHRHPIFLFFRGDFGAPGSVRWQIADAARALAVEHPQLQFAVEHTDVSTSAGFGDDDLRAYVEQMRVARFCPVARGATQWSRRLFEAILAGCLPVLVNDALVLPFERFVDFDRFLVRVPETAVARGLAQLPLMPMGEVARRKREMARVAPLFRYAANANSRGEPDAFAMIMAELGVRRSLAGWPAS